MATVADLNTDGATGTVIWYTTATGGTALAADAALTAGTYYAAQIGEDCERVERTAVEVNITETPAPKLTDRKSVVWGKSVSVRVELGCRRIHKKKKKKRR